MFQCCLTKPFPALWPLSKWFRWRVRPDVPDLCRGEILHQGFSKWLNQSQFSEKRIKDLFFLQKCPEGSVFEPSTLACADSDTAPCKSEYCGLFWKNSGSCKIFSRWQVPQDSPEQLHLEQRPRHVQNLTVSSQIRVKLTLTEACFDLLYILFSLSNSGGNCTQYYIRCVNGSISGKVHTNKE